MTKDKNTRKQESNLRYVYISFLIAYKSVINIERFSNFLQFHHMIKYFVKLVTHGLAHKISPNEPCQFQLDREKTIQFQFDKK